MAAYESVFDAGYSNGENYMFLQQRNITAFIPLSGGTLITSEGFVYDEKNDRYIHLNNKILKGNGKIIDDGKGNPVKKYFSSEAIAIAVLSEKIVSVIKQNKKGYNAVITHHYMKPPNKERGVQKGKGCEESEAQQ
jgi:hypothetical protein